VIRVNLSPKKDEGETDDNKKKYERNVRRNDCSLNVITWSKHSLRIEPMTRST